MRIGQFTFRPGLWPTLAVLVIFPCLVSLGLWQQDRARQKQELLDAHAARAGDAPLQLARPLASGAGLRYRAALAAGRYDSDHQYLLDNRVHRGRAGYEVLTPLCINGTGSAVLVNRGWIPQGVTRRDLPTTGVPTTVRQVKGILDVPAEDVFSLGAGEERDPGWPKVLQHVDLALHEKQLGYRLLPVILRLDPGAPDGYVREWRPVVFGPERHRGYAFQWFSLAAALVLIYLFVNIRRAGSGEANR